MVVIIRAVVGALMLAMGLGLVALDTRKRYIQGKRDPIYRPWIAWKVVDPGWRFWLGAAVAVLSIAVLPIPD